MFRHLHEEGVVCLLHYLAYLARLDVEVHLSGLYARDVEDIVDELEQQLVVGVDGFGKELFFFGREVGIGLQQQVGEADDGIERGSDFVAHVGEEGLLELCFLCQSACFLQFGFTLSEHVDVHQHTVSSFKAAVFSQYTFAAESVPVVFAVAVDVESDLRRILFALLDSSHSFCQQWHVVGMDSFVKLARSGLVRGLSEELPEGVAQGDCVAMAFPYEGLIVLDGEVEHRLVLFCHFLQDPLLALNPEQSYDQQHDDDEEHDAARIVGGEVEVWELVSPRHVLDDEALGQHIFGETVFLGSLPVDEVFFLRCPDRNLLRFLAVHDLHGTIHHVRSDGLWRSEIAAHKGAARQSEVCLDGCHHGFYTRQLDHRHRLRVVFQLDVGEMAVTSHDIEHVTGTEGVLLDGFVGVTGEVAQGEGSDGVDILRHLTEFDESVVPVEVVDDRFLLGYLLSDVHERLSVEKRAVDHRVGMPVTCQDGTDEDILHDVYLVLDTRRVGMSGEEFFVGIDDTAENDGHGVDEFVTGAECRVGSLIAHGEDHVYLMVLHGFVQQSFSLFFLLIFVEVFAKEVEVSQFHVLSGFAEFVLHLFQHGRIVVIILVVGEDDGDVVVGIHIAGVYRDYGYDNYYHSSQDKHQLFPDSDHSMSI